MGQVTVTINSRNYQIACDEGQEQHLKTLAEYVDKRVSELVAVMGQVGEARLLIMASLLLADEARDVQQDLAAAHAKSRQNGGQDALRDAALANEIDALAAEIESMAALLEDS